MKLFLSAVIATLLLATACTNANRSDSQRTDSTNMTTDSSKRMHDSGSGGPAARDTTPAGRP